MYLMQRCRDGLVIRMFLGRRLYRKGQYLTPELQIKEIRRTICGKDGLPSRAYYWDRYKHMEMRWIAEGFSGLDPYWAERTAGSIYGYTLPSLFHHELSRTGFQEVMKLYRNFNPEGYLDLVKDTPPMEKLVKANLPGLTLEVLSSYWTGKECFLFPNASSITKILGLDSQKLKRLRQADGGSVYLKWLQCEKQSGKTFPDEVLRWYMDENISPNHLRFILDRMNVLQVYHYIRRQMAVHDMTSKDVLITWKDYLSMAVTLKMDVGDEIVYRVNRLCQRHNELLQAINTNRLGLTAVNIEEKYPKVTEILPLLKKYEYSDQTFAILAPESVKDILNDANALQHCVLTKEEYMERIVSQESYLLFLRKVSDMQVPYYTLEVEPDGTIRQKRSKFNRQNKDIEQAEHFLSQWQKVIAERITEEERKLSKKSRVLRVQEIEQLRKDQVIIHTGDLKGQLLADVLQADLMENDSAA